MPLVRIPDKNVYIRFPDDMSREEIEMAIRVEVYGEAPPPPRYPTEPSAFGRYTPPDYEFQEWYKKHAEKWGLHPDPYHPKHFYDYKAAFEAGAEPDEFGHLPDAFKLPGHPTYPVVPPETVEPMGPLPPETPEREMAEPLTRATGFVASVGRAAGRKLIPPALDWELDSQRELAKGLYRGGEPIPQKELVDHFINPEKYGLPWTPMPPEEAKQFVEDQQNLELAEEGIWLGIILYAGIQGARALPYVGRAVKEGFSRVLWREDPMPIVRQIQKLGLSYERMVEINRGAKATEEELAKYKQLGKLTERKLRKPFEWVMKRFRAEPTEVFVRGKPPEPSVRRALPGPPGVAARPAPEVREPVPRVYEEKPMAVVTPKLPEARVVGKRVQVFPRHAELMKEIDEAIKKAPTIEETVTEDGKKLPGWKETVKFKVDGEHEIINTKEALEAYKNLVKRKEWAVLKQRQKGFAGYPEAVPVAGKQVEFGDYIIMKEKGWISDGEMAIKAEIPAKSKPNEAYKAAYGEKRPAVKDIMPEEKNLQDAEFAYNALRTAEQQSVSRKPIYADPREYMEIPLSIFRVGDQYAHVRQKKIQFVKKHYPDAAWKVSPEETKAVAFDKGKPVAIVMGTKSSTTDFMAKEPELHEQAREAGLIVVPKKIKKPKIYPISDPRDLGKTTQELLDIPEGGRISWEDKGWVKTDKGWVPVGEEGRKGIGSQVFAEQIQREVKVAPPTRKKPWEMTRDQYWTEYVKRRWTAEEAEKPDYILRETEKLLKPHREAIQRALSEGKPVPPEVLAEYPKLAPPVEKVAEEFFDAKGNYIKVDKAPQGNWTFYRVPAHKKGLKGTRIKVRGAKAYYPTREEAVKALQEYAKKRGFIPRKLPEEVFAEAREKIAAQKETVKKWVDKHGPVSFEAEVRGYERPVTIRVTPSAKKPGFWQATFFDEKGPFRDIVLEDYPKLLAELVGPERIDLKTAKVRRLDEVIDKYYQEGLRKEKARKERGGVRMRIPSVALPKVTIGEKVKGAAKIIKDEFDRLKFFPHTPMAFRSAVRLDIIGKLDQRRIEIYDKTQVALWGGMETSDIRKSVEIIYARDQVSRTKLHKGDPKISLEEAQKILADAEKTASPEAIAAANHWREIRGEYTAELIRRGKLDPDDVIEDYTRHYVKDYTPDWVFHRGIPMRIKRPFRGYLKPAVGTSKEYRKDADALMGQLLEVEHDNIIEDFIINQAGKYDRLPALSREERGRLFGRDKGGRVNPPKPNRLYAIDGERYWGWTPDIPFSRHLFPSEKGYMSLGKYKNVYLIPEWLRNSFKGFSEGGNRSIYYLNRATGYWKTAAILSHFPSFSVNNAIGDTWFALIQHPEPHKFLGEWPTATNWLAGKRGGYLDRLDKFIKDEDIIMSTFIAGELPKIRAAPDPLRWILDKTYKISYYREAFDRVAYASTAFKAMEEGRGAEFIKAHPHIDTEGLSERDALGKISRDAMIDYSWVSKAFRKYIRGGAFPFGTWYFKGSPLLYRWMFKHWGKGLAIMMGLPIGAALYNNRDEKTKELEAQLPDYVRNRIHIVLGENPDGTIRAWSSQLPQDVLIGTKIFSIAVDYANRAYNKEMTVKEAAVQCLKTWGVREAKGISYLSAPMIRFMIGWAKRRDPYDNSPIFKRDPTRMTAWEKRQALLMYFIKCSVPFLSISIANYERGLPRDVAFRRLVDNLAGKGAFGIHDTTKKGTVWLFGKEYDWNDVGRIHHIKAKTDQRLDRIEDKFVDSQLSAGEFLKSPMYKKEATRIFDLWASWIPEFKEEKNPDKKALFITALLSRRIKNRLIGPDTLRKWYIVAKSRAKTPEEKRRIAKEYALMQKLDLLDTIKRMPKAEREVYFINKLSESELPWDILLELPVR